MSEPDRYISFCNIDCDNNANLLVSMLEHHLTANHGHAQWHSYFENKRQEQANMQRDNLNFVGNQLNMLYEYFRECEDQNALDLLYQIEQECC
ncbi:N(2)-fixation sustaining protein CowN [Vibrio sp. AK197]|uniref:N(2)-fixation sustaining protein CowN n=1 Tax=Vibrio olivae TaxID=1243002 RepID=A0ABV5HJA3_9VIBR